MSKEEETMKVFDLVVKGKMLPARLEELVPLSFIGAAAVSFYKAKVKVMKELGMAEGQRKATLADGQDAGECLLRIEARIGELLPDEKAMKAPSGSGRRSIPDALGKTESERWHRSSNAKAIHRNPKAVERVIKEARKNEDIPTKTAVLMRIKLDKMKAGQPKPAREKPDIVEFAEEVYKGLIDSVTKVKELWKHVALVPPYYREGIEEAVADLANTVGGNHGQ